MCDQNFVFDFLWIFEINGFRGRKLYIFFFTNMSLLLAHRKTAKTKRNKHKIYYSARKWAIKCIFRTKIECATAFKAYKGIVLKYRVEFFIYFQDYCGINQIRYKNHFPITQSSIIYKNGKTTKIRLQKVSKWLCKEEQFISFH